MFALTPTSSLPQNADMHVRLRWRRGPFGVPVLAPAIVVGTRAGRG